jgi:ketopantoate reductase
MEHMTLTGAIVRAGRLNGIETPLNDFLLGLLEAVSAAP